MLTYFFIACTCNCRGTVYTCMHSCVYSVCVCGSAHCLCTYTCTCVCVQCIDTCLFSTLQLIHDNSLEKDSLISATAYFVSICKEYNLLAESSFLHPFLISSTSPSFRPLFLSSSLIWEGFTVQFSSVNN